MSTVIKFNASDGQGALMYTYVAETPEQVLEAWNRAGGAPFTVTHEGSGRRTYMNPQNIACWFEQTAPGGDQSGN